MQENINFTISRHGINVRFHRELTHQEQQQNVINDASLKSFHQDGQYHHSNWGTLSPSKISTIEVFPYQVASINHEETGNQKSYKILQVRYDGNKNILQNKKKQSHNYETESDYFGDSEQNISSESYFSRSQPLPETSSDYEADIDDMESNISPEWEEKCLHLFQLFLKKKKKLEKRETKAAYEDSVESYRTDYHSQAQLPTAYRGKSSQDSHCQTISTGKLNTQSEGHTINANGSAEVAVLNSENNEEKQTRKKRKSDTSDQFNLLMSMLNQADEEIETTRKCKRCWNEGLHTEHYPRSRYEKSYFNGEYDNQFDRINPLNQMKDPSWHLSHNHNTFVKPASNKLNFQNPLPYSIKHKILKVPKKKYHIFNQKPFYERSEYSDLLANSYIPMGSQECLAKIKQSLADRKQKTLFLPSHYPNVHHLLHHKLIPTHNHHSPYTFHSFNNEELSYPTFHSDSYETYDEYIQNGEIRDNSGGIYPHQQSSGTDPVSDLNYHINQMNREGSYDMYNENHQFSTLMNTKHNYVRKDEISSENWDNTNTFDKKKTINGFNADSVADQNDEIEVNVRKEADELSRGEAPAVPPSQQNFYFDHKLMNNKYMHPPITPMKPNFNQPFDGTKEVASFKHSPPKYNNAWVNSDSNILNPENLREIYETLPTNYEFSAGQWVHIKPAMQPQSSESDQVRGDQNKYRNYDHTNKSDKYSASQAKERSNLNGEIHSYTSNFSEISTGKQDGNIQVNDTKIPDEQECNTNGSFTKKSLNKLQQMNIRSDHREENWSKPMEENVESPHFSVQETDDHYDQWTKGQNKLASQSNIDNKNTTPSTSTKVTEFFKTTHHSFTDNPTQLGEMQSVHKSQELHDDNFDSFHKEQTYTTPFEHSVNKIQLINNEVDEKQDIQDTFLPSVFQPSTTFTEAYQDFSYTPGNQITDVPKLQFSHNKFYSFNTAPSTLDRTEPDYIHTESWFNHNEIMQLTQNTNTTTTEYIPAKSKNYNIETQSLHNDVEVFHSTSEISTAQGATTAGSPEMFRRKEKFGFPEQIYSAKPLFNEHKSNESSSTTIVPDDRSGDSKETNSYSLIHSTPVTFQLTSQYKAQTSEINSESPEGATSNESSKTTSIPTFKDKPNLNDHEGRDDSNVAMEENDSTTTCKENKGTMTPQSVNFCKTAPSTTFSSVDIHTMEYLYKFDFTSPTGKEEMSDLEPTISETTPLHQTTSSKVTIEDLKTTGENFPESGLPSTNTYLEHFTEKTYGSTINTDYPRDQNEFTSTKQNQILNLPTTAPNEDNEGSKVDTTKGLSSVSGENTDFSTSTPVVQNYKSSEVTSSFSSTNTNHSGPIFNLFQANIPPKSLPSSKGNSVIILHNNTRYVTDSQFQDLTSSLNETTDDISQIPSTPRSLTSYTVTKEDNSIGTVSMTTIFSPSSSVESSQHATDKTDSFVEGFTLGNTVSTPQPESQGIHTPQAHRFFEIQDNRKYYDNDDLNSQGDKEDYEYYEGVNADPPQENDKPHSPQVSVSLGQSKNKQSEYITSSSENFTSSTNSGSSSWRTHEMQDVPEYSGSILILNPLNGEVTHNIPVTGKILPQLSHYSSFPFTYTHGNTNSWVNNAVSHRSEGPIYSHVPTVRGQVTSESQFRMLDPKEHYPKETPIMSYKDINENTTQRTNISGTLHQDDIVSLQEILMQSNYFTASTGIENSSEALNPTYIVATSPEENSALKESSILTAIYNPSESSKRILIPTYKPSILTSIKKNSTCESAYKQYIYKYFLRVLLTQYLEEIKNNDNNQCTEFCIGGKLPSVCDECIKQLMQDQKQDEQDFAERIKLYNSQHCLKNYNGSEQYLENSHPCAVYSSCKFSVISSILEKFGQWLRNI